MREHNTLESADAPVGEQARQFSGRVTSMQLKELRAISARGCHKCQRATAKIVGTAGGYRALCSDHLVEHELDRRVARQREQRDAMKRRA